MSINPNPTGPVPAKIDPNQFLAPKNMMRCCLDPSWNIQVFRITSDDIKAYLDKKVKKFVPSANVQVQPRYIENRLAKKRNAEASPTQSAATQSYASLLVAFSSDIIDRGNVDPAYRWVVEGNNDVRIIDNVYNHLIRSYRYNREALKELLKDYQSLDHLKERFGMTEEYIRNLLSMCDPYRSQHSDSGWVIFAASAERIIEDMLTEITVWEPKANLVNPTDPTAPALTVVPHQPPTGRMEIVKVNKISQELVEFVVYLHMGEFRSADNPELRKLFESFK